MIESFEPSSLSSDFLDTQLLRQRFAEARSQMDEADERLRAKTKELRAKVQRFDNKVTMNRTHEGPTNNGESPNADHHKKVQQPDTELTFSWPKLNPRSIPNVGGVNWPKRRPHTDANLDFTWPEPEEEGESTMTKPKPETRRMPVAFINPYEIKNRKSPGILSRLKNAIKPSPKPEIEIPDPAQEKTIRRKGFGRAIGIAAVALVAVSSGVFHSRFSSEEHDTHSIKPRLLIEKEQPQLPERREITPISTEIPPVPDSIRIQRGENDWTISRKILVQQGNPQPNVQQIADQDNQILKLNNLAPEQTLYLHVGDELKIK